MYNLGATVVCNQDINFFDVYKSTAARCDGSYSCQYARIYSNIPGGNIYLTGYEVGYSSVIQAAKNGDIVCSDQYIYSCKSAEITS